MKKSIKKILILFLLTVSCIALTGCKGIKIGNKIFYFGTYTGPAPTTDNSESASSPEEDLSGLILILGNHANSKEFDITKDFDPNTGKYKDLINDAIHTVKANSGYVFQVDINVIVNDGNPQKVELPNDLLQVSTGSLEFEKADRADMAQEIAEYLTDEQNKELFIANNEHADLLSSLGIAASIIKNNPNTKYTVFVYDTGICTSGSLNMVEKKHIDLVEDNVDDIINRIYAEDICSLNGADVYIPYLLNVSDKQNYSYYEDGVQDYIWNVSDLQEKMVNLWSGVVEKCGGTIATIACNKLDGATDMDCAEGDDTYPYVPTVTFYKVHPVEEREKTSEEVKPDPIVADSSTLGFEPGTAKFRKGEKGEDGETAAKNTIAPFINSWKEYLKQDNNNVLYVVGSVAKLDKNEPVQEHDQVSEDRAKEVKRILKEELKDEIKEKTISTEQIIVKDAGETVLRGWRDADEFANGEFDTNIAQKNRVVAIIPNCESSDACAKMLKVLRECGLVN